MLGSGGIWQQRAAFTPVWGATTPPALGNGTLTGRYIKTGHLVLAQYDLVMGSTTTFGSGAWTFTVPFTPVAGKTYCGDAFAFENGVAFDNAGCIFLPSVGKIQLTAGVGNGNFINSGFPWNWAAGDELHFTLPYESV